MVKKNVATFLSPLRHGDTEKEQFRQSSPYALAKTFANRYRSNSEKLITPKLVIYFFKWLSISCLTLLTLTGCQGDPQEQLRSEGHKITRLLIQDLKKVKNRDDLLVVGPDLERHFTLLGQAMLKGRSQREKGVGTAQLELRPEDHSLSEELREQINRVCQIEGGRQVISTAQKAIRDLLTDRST